MSLLIFAKAMLAVLALWWTTSTIGNMVQGREIPWWALMIMSVLIVLWGYLEYYV